MIRSSLKLRSADGIVFCFLASVIIAVISFNLGFVIEPGKYIPTELTMRSGDLNENIIRGIDLALADIGLIRSGTDVVTGWRLLTFIHTDLFFYLALILPAACSKTVLLLGYYIRFGLCCAVMYYFLSEHIRLSRLPSALLAVMYAFSSQIIFTAQFASMMNMAIMMPVLLSCFDSYLRKRTWKHFAFVCFGAFGLAFSGGYGILTGLPFMAFAGLLMAISLYKTAKMAFTSWLRLLLGLAAGFTVDMAFAIPGLETLKTKVDIQTSLSDSRATYTVFDLIRGSFLLRSGSISTVGIPIFYVGMLTLIAALLFALNEQIPTRLKVASAVLLAVMHISCCSSLVNETLSFFGTSSLLMSSRLICMEVVLFFIAGIGLKNINSLSKGHFIAGCLIPLFFLVMSGVSVVGTSLATPILLATFLGIIGEAGFVYAMAKDKLKGRSRYAVLFAGFILVGINSAFIFFNNTIQSGSVDDYFNNISSSGISNVLITDNDLVLPAISGDDRYILIPGDLSLYEVADSYVDNVNYLSKKAAGSNLFKEISVQTGEGNGMFHEVADIYRISEGKNEITIMPYPEAQGDSLYIYCSSQKGAAIHIISGDNASERVFEGPFLTRTDAGLGNLTFEMTILSDSDDRIKIAVYSMDETVLEALEEKSANIDTNGGRIYINGLNRAAKENTLILPFDYDDTIKVSVNGADRDTFSFCGKTAVTFECGDEIFETVNISQKKTALLPGILISFFAAACLIAIPVLQRYNDKKNESAEGNLTNA